MCDWYSISGPGCRCMGLMNVIGIVSMALGVGVWN